MRKFQAHGRNIFLKEEIQEKKQGILILDSDNENHIIAKIISLGNEADEILKEGEKVLMFKYGYQEIEIDGEKFLISKSENIIGKYADV